LLAGHTVLIAVLVIAFVGVVITLGLTLGVGRHDAGKEVVQAINSSQQIVEAVFGALGNGPLRRKRDSRHSRAD
jgi:hypothetical protein